MVSQKQIQKAPNKATYAIRSMAPVESRVSCIMFLKDDSDMWKCARKVRLSAKRKYENFLRQQQQQQQQQLHNNHYNE